MNTSLYIKKVTTTLAVLLLIGITIDPVLGLGTNDQWDNFKTNLYYNKIKSNFHSPITIDGNDDFTKKNGVRSGNGTLKNPYIISEWKMSSLIRNGISISNTNAYFIVENCYIDGYKLIRELTGMGAFGIFLNNVTNGKIINCFCSNFKNSYAIFIMSSSDNIIENCVCQNSQAGLSVNGCPQGYESHSNNNTIRNCSFYSCDDGIYFCCLPSSKNNVIDSCVLEHNKRGICLDHCIHYTTITGCNISNNTEIGLEIISASSNNHISGNIFWNNKVHAEDNCKDFWDNGPYFQGNYWSGHNSSNPYEIPGAGNNKDDYPLNKEPKGKQLISLFMYHPEVAIRGGEICFDGSLSFEQNNEITDYEWDFNDGTYAIGRRVFHTYMNNGSYNVSLRIKNDTMNDTFEKTINVIDLVDGELYVSNGQLIQDAINAAEPGYNIYVDSGIYHENIVVNKPYLNIIGNDYNDTVIDGHKNGNVVYITAPLINISGFTIKNSSEDKAGIQIGIPDFSIDCFGCSVKKNLILYNNIGINMSETERNLIFDNVIKNNDFGIKGIRSYANVIEKNEFSSNENGLRIEYGSNWNNITRNIFINNSIGIFFSWSHFNNIFKNDIRKNYIGIKLINAISPVIIYNNICRNSKSGIVFTGNLKNAKNNWWGSFLGPSFILKIFGDRVIGVDENERLMLFSRFTRLTGCRPWRKAPVDILNP